MILLNNECRKYIKLYLMHQANCACIKHYRNDPKFSDRQVWANSADRDQTAPLGAEQSDPGIHCLLFNLHLLETFLYCKTNLLEF